MITLLSVIITIISVAIGKYVFKKIFNPIFLYTSSWLFTLALYELNWINYPPVSERTWIIAFVVYLAFLFGVLTLYLSRSLFDRTNLSPSNKNEKPLLLLSDGGKKLKWIINITAIIGLLTALQHWYALINEFGGIAGVFLKGESIYRMRVEGEHLNKIPYLTSLSFIGIYLSAYYSAYKNKISSLVILPLIGIVLSEAANLSRAGVFYAFVLFVIVIVTTKYFFASNPKYSQNRSNKKLIISFVLISVFTVASVIAIKFIRNPIEGEYQNTSSSMRQFRGSILISPSLYLYFSSPIVVLEKYLTKLDEEDAYIGENTFYPVYNTLSKFNVVDGLSAYPKGYFIPMWTNSATYIRELHVDFGWLGVFLVPYLIGFMSSFFWFKFFDTGKFSMLVLYSMFVVATVFSVFYIVTRLTLWYITIISLLIISLLEKMDNQISVKDTKQ